MIQIKRLIFSAVIVLLPVVGIRPQQTVRMNAVKANNYGVIYSLPKTSLVVTLKVKKTVFNRGEFYQYAQRYLNIDPITESRTEFTLEDVMVTNRGVVDKENSYMVIFRPNSLAPYVYLTQEGLISTINAEPVTEEPPTFELPAPSPAPLNPRRFLSEETLMAGSTAKQAELVAKQIFDLRRSRNDILIGEADNMPPDGEAYKVVMEQINAQEKALTEMFSGSTQTEYFTREIVIVPTEKEIDRMIIGRFSVKLGPVDADNLAGEPIYLTLRNKTPKIESAISDKERERLEKKLSEGVVYNVPGKAQLILEFKNRALKDMEVDVVQFGTKDVLVKKMFDNMKQPIKVIFYPELGAIRQIIQ
ncbi:DUF4831 family protein [Petrimonas mucosa]|jgi:hypothetical protein|uniref:DUF4831 family protein n=1 Tax=Petrimonas mucosa TaxID=1642646 RepID=UPI0023F15BC2|nr:DUF4831 family protein [Petrimonas mucosa]MDD3560447.1 DUF4831 family protein [Petrimonas mucosa]